MQRVVDAAPDPSDRTLAGKSPSPVFGRGPGLKDPLEHVKEIAAIVDADPNVVVDMDADVVAVVLLDALSCSWTSLRSNETGQHGDDALKELTWLAEVDFTEHSQRLQSVEHGCALQRGALAIA